MKSLREVFIDVELESGEVLPEINVQFTTYGELNQAKDNVVWICHALTGDDKVHRWWNGLFGSGKVLDPANNYIICANSLGSCYGTTGPHSPETPQLYRGINFPIVTTRDMAQVHELLAQRLGLNKIKLLLGASLGGQQAMEWAIKQPERFEKIGLIATNAKHSAHGIAFNEAQRMALWADETFRSNYYAGGQFGLKAARAIALLSYRTSKAYNSTQRETSNEKTTGFLAASYQQYQGEKLVKRFNAFSYWALTKAMDAHNVGRFRISVEEALGQISAKTLVVSITSDQLFPTHEQEFLVKHIPEAHHVVIDSSFGHDGFLVEEDLLCQQVKKFLNDERVGISFTSLKKVSNY